MDNEYVKLNAIETRKTGIVEARVDYRIFADIALWAASKGMRFTTRGEMVRTVVEIFHDMLVKQGSLVPIKTIEEALRTLDGLGLPIKDTKGRKKTFLGSELVGGTQVESYMHIRKVAEDAMKVIDMPERNYSDMDEMKRQTLALMEQAKKEGHLVEDGQDDECAPFDPDENIDVLSAISLKSHKRKEITEE
jgi:hypothetical protein